MFNVTIDKANIEKETEKAYGFDFGDGGITWLPKSQVSIEWAEPMPHMKPGTLTIPMWLAKNKGMYRMASWYRS